MSDSVSSNDNGGFSMSMSADAPSSSASSSDASAPSGNGDNGGGVADSAGINPSTIGSDGSGASFAGGGAYVTAYDYNTCVSVTAATQNPPMTLPALQTGVPHHIDVNPQVAKDEATLLGNLTTAVLAKIGVPTFIAAAVGSQVSANLQSPTGLAALQTMNETTINSVVLIGEAQAANPYNITIVAMP